MFTEEMQEDLNCFSKSRDFSCGCSMIFPVPVNVYGARSVCVWLLGLAMSSSAGIHTKLQLKLVFKFNFLA